MNKNYQAIIKYIKSIEKYQIIRIEGDRNIISINYKLLNNDINSLDLVLISILSKNELCRSIFFDKINDITLFNQNKFIEVIFKTNEYLDGSYTSYDNKIGLFLSENDSVILNFPYKDCVLVGGMDFDDEKNNLEVFYNELLEKNQIDKLFYPKILNNATKYSYNEGKIFEEKVSKINFKKNKDSNGEVSEILTDNLIIKGNNLIALHTIARKMRNMVDVIYIDPPYFFNDGKSSDTFAYNSNFKLSTWLTFMKNRLEIAKELLSQDGVICLSMNEDGVGYLKILMDEIFHKENFIDNLFILDNLKGNNNTELFSSVGEYCLVYAKNKKNIKIKELYIEDEKDEWDVDEKGYWKPGRALRGTGENAPREKRPTMFFPLYINPKTLEFSLEKDSEFSFELLPINEKGEELCWNWSKTKFMNEKNEVLISKNSNNSYSINKKQRPEISTKLSRKAKNLFYSPNYSTTVSSKDIKDIFDGKANFKYSKSRFLIKDLIQVLSKKDSIILDFFAGSGTTGHAVLDLNKEDNGTRRFVLLEQMDYVETLTAERIKKVLNRESIQDSFIYMELMESVSKKIKMGIKGAKTIDELNHIIENNFNSGVFINIKNKKELIDTLANEYSLVCKKEGVKQIVNLIISKYFDNNLDYNSFCDIEEFKSKINLNDYELNKLFFGDK